MAILTTAVIVGTAAIAVIGGLTHLFTGDAREKKEIKNRLEEIEAALSGFGQTLEKYSVVKDNLSNAIEYLTDGKNDFTDGGHVQDGKPLADELFSDSLHKLYSAFGSVENLVRDLNDTIADLKRQKRELEARLAELNK